MATERYRKTPMHRQLQVGERVRRKAAPLVATMDRSGTVVGPCVERGRGIWYATVLWDGATRPETVHLPRVLRVEEVSP